MNRRTRQLVYGFELLVLGLVLLRVLIRQDPYHPPATLHLIAFGRTLAGLLLGGVSAFGQDR